MIRSMTGFAALSREANGDKVSVTIKSVNHRFLDVLLKAPQILGPMEARLRSLIQHQYQGVLANHDRIKALRDQYASM